MLLRAAAGPESPGPLRRLSVLPIHCLGDLDTTSSVPSVLARLSLKGPVEGDRHRVQPRLPEQRPGCSALGERLWVPAGCPTRCYAPREKGAEKPSSLAEMGSPEGRGSAGRLQAPGVGQGGGH